MRLVKHLHTGMKTATDRGARGEISMARFAVEYFIRFLSALVILIFLSISDKLVSTTKGQK